MATKRPAKAKVAHKFYDLEKLLRDFREDPDRWADHWALWQEYEGLRKSNLIGSNAGYNKIYESSYKMREAIRAAALESVGTDPVLAAANIDSKKSSRILENHPLLPVWHDIGNEDFLNVVYDITATSLENTVRNGPEISDRDRAVDLAYDVISKIDPDVQLGQVDRDDIVLLCRRGHAPTLANLTERIFLECNVPEEERYGHLYRHVFPEPP